jgi:hypothetical protein
MSLIQDALKRKLEEAGENPTALPPQETAAAPANEKRPQPLLIILILLLLAGLITLLIGLSLYLIKPKQPATAPAVLSPAPVAAAPVVVIPAPAAPKEPAAVEAVVEPVVEAAPTPEAKPEWPELKLAGIAKMENQSLAILNGKMISAGRTLGEILVVEVNEKDIVVEYRGERRVLYINE